VTTLPAKLKNPDRFPIGMTIATVVAFAILISLGEWQLKRLAWKTQVLAEVAASRTADAVPLASALALPLPDYHRVTVTCPGLATADFVLTHAITDGDPGRRVISPCLLGEGAILVDRGFISDTTPANPPVSASQTALTLNGVLTKGNRGNLFTPPPAGKMFYAHDVAAMAKALGVSTATPYFIAAETSTNPDLPSLKPEPLPVDIPNNHFEYALTWFGLAAALLAIYAAKLSPWLSIRLKRR
jgi:surfeit locus 1 family protein